MRRHSGFGPTGTGLQASVRTFLSIAILLFFAACKDKQAVVRTTPVQPPPPAWVSSRPVSSADYVGIGLASKSRSDFQEAAKKNALNDLASEISVKVEGNSLLYTLDRKSSFDESFTSTINTKTSEQLEGFELVDNWENGSEYWVYYRLSKAEHARIKAEKKRQAIAQATDLYARSQASLAAGDLKSAVDQDLRALLAIKDYWGENDEVLIGERSVPLANEIYNDLQRITSGVRLVSLPERCALDHDNHFKRELLLTVRSINGTTSRDLAQLPLVMSYPGTSGKVTTSSNTDGEGQARTTVQGIDLGATGPELLVRVDMEALVSRDLDPTFVKPLLSSLNAPELRVPIDVRLPKVHMTALEKNLGRPLNEAGAALAIRQELTTKGFRFVEKEREADLLMTVTAVTREGGTSNGFFTAFLDLAIACKDRRTQDVIYTGGKQGVKGVQLTYDKAGLEAYKKAVQDIRQEVVPALMNAIL
jgi:hypothetical protein